MNVVMSDGLVISNGEVTVDGEKVPFPKKLDGSISNAVIGNKIYLNGYEFCRKTKKWKRSIFAIWHLLF